MFVTRLISGIVLMIIAFVSFFFGAPILPLVLLFISIVAYGELAKAFGFDGVLEYVGYVGCTVYYALLLLKDYCVFSDGALLFQIAVVLVFLALLFVYVLKYPKYQCEQVAAAVFSFLYAPVMLSFIDFTRQLEQGKLLVWLVLICSWGCDTCAYCVGMLIGKKKIFPLLSPKKSLEGCIGGVIGAALLGLLYGCIFFERTAERLVPLAIICALGAMISMVGDLAASAIKRNKGIKDYGTLIPGHGGIMDRFDSVIVTAPLVYFLCLYLV